MNQLQALEEEDGPAGTSKENQLEHLSGPSMMMSLVTTSCSADEERSAGARGPAGTEVGTTAFCLRAKDSADGFALGTSRYNSQEKPAGSFYIQTKATAHPVESFNEPAVAMHSVARCCTSRKQASVL
ncbi:hypothetical protein F511_38075 [Dorcoceras hygrometricum]|uniref:Uncharacterized protein n=1 Tax=Dorcoceras hygrometricum TaxID=472368 RepID=A0A2Z7AIM3_9LAMI|nr:hypothetical protein F511_38075 [Dorcoceras hygrometricum]